MPTAGRHWFCKEGGSKYEPEKSIHASYPLFEKKASKNSPVEYPTWSPLQELPLQCPNTPKSIPSKVARGMPLTIGVDITESSRRTKATKSRIDKGVAGRSILSDHPCIFLCHSKRPAMTLGALRATALAARISRIGLQVSASSIACCLVGCDLYFRRNLSSYWA